MTEEIKVVAEWPKWVPLHPSQMHIKSDAKPAHISAHAWPDTFTDRTGKTSVLCHNKGDEERAGMDVSPAPPAAPAAPAPAGPAPAKPAEPAPAPKKDA